MRKLRGVFKIIRPLNFLITFIAVWIAGTIASKGIALSGKIFLAGFSAALIAASGNIVNDLFDVEIDKISHPERPLVKGELEKHEAAILYNLVLFGGLFLTKYINVLASTIAIASAILLFLYSCCIKKMPLIGNFLVATMTGLAFIYGGVAVGKIKFALFPALFALLANFSREILKDVQDIEGDKKAGIKTFPVVSGIPASVFVSKLSAAVLIVTTLVAYFCGFYTVTYLAIVVFVDIALLYFLFVLKAKPSKREIKKMSALLKAAMVVGLVAVWVGAK